MRAAYTRNLLPQLLQHLNVTFASNRREAVRANIYCLLLIGPFIGSWLDLTATVYTVYIHNVYSTTVVYAVYRVYTVQL